MSAPRPGGARLVVLGLAGVCLLAVGFLLGRVTSAPERQASYLQQLTDMLDLRPDQVAAIERVLSDEDRDLDALINGSLQGVTAQAAARRSRTEQQLLAVLDPAQRQRYDNLVAAGTGR